MTEAAAVEFRDVTRSFKTHTVLDGVDLRVGPGEFLTLLGPSGCGKSTLLRLLSGFDRPTTGKVFVAGEDVTMTPAHRRPVNMVFQRSTLFPHLDVAGNIAFGLKLDRAPKHDIATRVEEALELVKLGGYGRRRSSELSGGQVQRVALARALVKRPRVLLLDEPLSALDLKIRLAMEVELRRIHRETGATFIYVTHDQREALALSDRIAVLNSGRIEQIGPPGEIYETPSTPFVAGFVGDANVIPVNVLASAAGWATVSCGASELQVRDSKGLRGSAWLVLRPEQLRLSAVDPIAERGRAIDGTVVDVAFRGSGYTYEVAVDGLDRPVKAEPAVDGAAAFGTGTQVRMYWEERSGALLDRPVNEAAAVPR